MPHTTEGVLRRLLDEPAGVGDADRRHVAGCSTCLRALDAVRADAEAVGAALAQAGPVDVEAAWQRLQGSTSVVVPLRPSRSGRLRAVARRPAVAALAVAVVLTGAGTAAANDWLQVFRTEQVAAVSITTADLLALPDLSAYGELELTSDPQVHEVADLAAAEAETGLDVPEVADLPRGIDARPVVQVGGQAVATFVFSAARAEDRTGEALPPPPPGLEGSRVRLVAGPGVAQVWPSSTGLPALVVGRAVAPTAYSSGVPFEVVRDHLLSLPGFPADLAAQLRAFTGDGSTLPLPVPADEVRSRSTEVDGRPATLLTSRDRAFAAVVWVEDGAVTVVAGSLDDSEVLRVAEDLR